MANKLGQTIHDTIIKLEDLYLEKNYEDVIKIITESSVLQQNHEALLILANCLLCLGGRDQEALKVLLDLEENMQSNSGKIKNLIGTIYWKLGDEQKALIYLQQAVAFEPRLADAKFNLAILMEKHGDTINSKLYLEDIIIWEPKHYNTLVHLGVIEAKEGYYDLASEYLKRARNIRSNEVKVSYNLANIFIKQAKFEEAAPLLEEALYHEEKNLKILQKLMVCYGKTDDYEKLENICKKVLSLDKNNAKAIAFLSRALKENNKFSQLEKLLVKIDTKLNKLTNKTNKKDTVMKIKSKLKDKIEEVKNLIFFNNKEDENESEEDKELPIMNVMKIEINEDPNIYKYKDIIQSDPNNKEALFFLGNDAFKNNDFETAYSMFSKLQEIFPNFNKEKVLERLGKLSCYKGFIEFKKKKWKEALEKFEMVNNTKPIDIICIKIGRCYEKLKMYNEAFLYYKKSLEITKDYIWGLYYLGSFYIRTGRTDEGLKLLKQAVDKNSNNSEIVFRYCEELIKDNDQVDNVINLLTKNLDLVIEDPNIMLLLAKAYDKKENYTKAIEVLEEAMMHKDFNTNPTKIFQLGILYEKTMNFNKAIVIYKNILNINKDHIPSLCHLGSILSHAKEFKRAMKYLKYALTVDENLPLVHYGIGKIYQANNQLDEAMKSYNKCLELDSKCYKYVNDKYRAYFQIGLINLDSNLIEAAKENFEKCLFLNSEYTLAIIGIGNVYYEEANFVKAEEYHRRALRLDPNDIQAIISLAYSLSGQKKYEQAIEQYKRVIELDSELPDVYYNLGNAYYMIEKYDEAMKFYIKSIKLDENRPEVFYNLGNSFCIKENFKDAIRCYKKSIKLDPKNFETYFNLGNSYFVIGWYKEALECYTSSGSLGYDNTDLKFAFARVHIELGTDVNLKEAEKYLFELLKNDPNNNKYLFYYARLKESTNRNEAKNIYKKILESPNYVEKEMPQVRDNYNRLIGLNA